MVFGANVSDETWSEQNTKIVLLYQGCFAAQDPAAGSDAQQGVSGDGIVVEVYENEILVRGRDFANGQWIEGLEYTYPIG